MAVWNVIDHTEVGASGIVAYEETSISGSYDHLCLIASARSDTIDAGAYVAQSYIQLNGDTGTNYSRVHLNAGSTTAQSGTDTGIAYLSFQYGTCGPSTLADTFGTYELWIPNYANTTGQKQLFSKWSIPNNSTTDWQWYIGHTAGLWASTAAITAIKLYPAHASTKYDQYSTFTLYGINGAG
tara:strand:- start:201 stop:749 length:549 start_codon:yes stop_codon:yes gene_type:complete